MRTFLALVMSCILLGCGDLPPDPFPEGTIVQHIVSGEKGQVISSYPLNETWIVRFVNKSKIGESFQDVTCKQFEINKFDPSSR